MRVTTKGQVTIPLDVRKGLGIRPGSQVRFTLRGDVAVMEKIAANDRGRAIVAHMRGRATTGMTTDEIMRLTRGED